MASTFFSLPHTSPEFIQSRRKRAQGTEFACFVRHHTPHAVSITVPFGAMERVAAMPAPAYMALLEGNRARVSGAPRLGQEPVHAPPSSGNEARRPAAPAPTEEPKPSPAETPKKPRRAPKDDLDFYID